MVVVNIHRIERLGKDTKARLQILNNCRNLSIIGYRWRSLANYQPKRNGPSAGAAGAEV
jgi:hypothetical protein